MTTAAVRYVLVVEDEPDVAQLIKHTLERERDIRVEIVPAGDVALKSVADQIPDLIVLDLNLPVPSGVEVCRIRGCGPPASTCRSSW